MAKEIGNETKKNIFLEVGKLTALQAEASDGTMAMIYPII